MTISANNGTPKATSIQAPMPTDESGQFSSNIAAHSVTAANQSSDSHLKPFASEGNSQQAQGLGYEPSTEAGGSGRDLSSNGNRISPTNGGNDDFIRLPGDPKRAASAMEKLSTKCDATTYIYRRIGPLAREAREFPETANAWDEVARKWSGGGTNFERVWKHFVNQRNYTGPQTSLGTIYHAAQLAGWTYESFDADGSDECIE